MLDVRLWLSVPRSCIPPPDDQTNACVAGWRGGTGGKVLSPTTCPWSLMPRAMLERAPASVPRSCIPWPGVHRNACCSPVLVRLAPTTCPGSLIPYAQLDAPPSVPRSCTAPLGAQSRARHVAPDCCVPTTCPASLSAATLNGMLVVVAPRIAACGATGIAVGGPVGSLSCSLHATAEASDARDTTSTRSVAVGRRNRRMRYCMGGLHAGIHDTRDTSHSASCEDTSELARRSPTTAGRASPFA